MSSSPHTAIRFQSQRNLLRRGFGLVETTLGLLIFSVAVAALVKLWVDDFDVLKAQRQAEVLQTARLAGQQLVTHYRRSLLGSPAASITTDINGAALASAISPSSAAGGVTKWRFNRQHLVNLKLLPSDFPVNGIYGSLLTANLQFDIESFQSSGVISGTVCYDQPLLKGGQLDTLALGTILSQVTGNVALVTPSGGSGSTYQSGVLVASYPGAASVLRGSTVGVTPPNPIAGTPEGIVCGLVGDWGGGEAVARTTATSFVPLGSSCTEPNALAWVNPITAGIGPPQYIAWCNGAKWRLLNGSKVGDTCAPGQTALLDPSLQTGFPIQPLMCSTATATTTTGVFVRAKLLAFKENWACNAANVGHLAVGKSDQKIYECKDSEWINDVVGAVVEDKLRIRTGITAGDLCEAKTLGLSSGASPKLHFCGHTIVADPTSALRWIQFQPGP